MTDQPNEPQPPQEEEEEATETLPQCLKRTIREGAPLYNEGKKKECFELYIDTARFILEQSNKIKRTLVGQRLQQAIDEAAELGDTDEWGEAAWVLRHSFDSILNEADSTSNSNTSSKSKSQRTLFLQSPEEELSDDGSKYHWQDEQAQTETDFEKGQMLSDTAYILRASIAPQKHTRFTKTYENCFPGSEAVEVLTSLGLAAKRTLAIEKCNLLLRGSFIQSVSHETETTFKDGTRLYRFASREEWQTKLEELTLKEPAEGSEEAILVLALDATLELPSLSERPMGEEDGSGGGAEQHNQQFGGISARHLQPRRSSQLSHEQHTGSQLALQAAEYERFLDIQDRKHNFKTYPKCFVGNDAVSLLVEKELASSRSHAVQLLDALLLNGLISHVTRDHSFEDKHLFYRFTPVGEIKKAIDTTAALRSTQQGSALVRYTALIQRYKQFTGLDVEAIMNSFFGCDDESGWDKVDLDNWRQNMKRWGFGRREDQDDDMVAKLAPLCVNVDPDTWDVTGDEQWESPYGILAQIAIFDQIPRSSFRGTPEAFKWDELAIRATKVALEKGYFETAFQSSLNQFLILLPLEHSESWEDQKLGVSLLLQMLSTTAVQDEGLSDYEIVKRLEFSKRLTTAFLEHAQVIAKFKRYPHRNRAHGRTTSLEERIWLASDLVPRWAQSQNPEASRNVIRLPVIPLKKFTRGR